MPSATKLPTESAIKRVKEVIIGLHQASLAGRLQAIIVCGSFGTKEYIPDVSDVDYIVVLDTMDHEALVTTAQVRYRLASTTTSDMSNTVITLKDLMTFQADPLGIDAKASQALLQAHAFRRQVIYKNPDFSYHLPPVSVIAAYSRANFKLLHTQLRKCIARTETQLGDVELNDMAKALKILLIAMKMKGQALQPQTFTVINAGNLHWQSKLSTVEHALYKEAVDYKNQQRTLGDIHLQKSLITRILAFMDTTETEFQTLPEVR